MRLYIHCIHHKPKLGTELRSPGTMAFSVLVPLLHLPIHFKMVKLKFELSTHANGKTGGAGRDTNKQNTQNPVTAFLETNACEKQPSKKTPCTAHRWENGKSFSPSSELDLPQSSGQPDRGLFLLLCSKLNKQTNKTE